MGDFHAVLMKFLKGYRLDGKMTWDEYYNRKTKDVIALFKKHGWRQEHTDDRQ